MDNKKKDDTVGEEISAVGQRVKGAAKEMLGDISDDRGLERDGFVVREQFPTIPPRVEYELTELGRELLQPVTELADWARRNGERVVRARARFDGGSE